MEEADDEHTQFMALYRTMGYLTTLINIISCTILYSTIWHASKVAEKHKNEKMDRELRLNGVVTLLQITIILACSIA